MAERDDCRVACSALPSAMWERWSVHLGGDNSLHRSVSAPRMLDRVAMMSTNTFTFTESLVAYASATGAVTLARKDVLGATASGIILHSMIAHTGGTSFDDCRGDQTSLILHLEPRRHRLVHAVRLQRA